MPNEVSIRIDGLPNLYAILDRAARGDMLNPAMRAGGEMLRRYMQVYGVPPRNQPYPFVSEKQRRYVMMLAAQGMLPYRRTGQLGRAWTVEMRGRGWDTSAVVGNSTPYGPYVQSAQNQAQYHSGRWRTDQQVVDQYGDNIRAQIINNLIRALNF